MTEAEWLARTDPRPMIQFLRAWYSSRKFKLFAVAALRRVPGSTCTEEEWERTLDNGAREAEARTLAERVFWRRYMDVQNQADAETIAMFLTTVDPVTAALFAANWAMGFRRGPRDEAVYDRPEELPVQAALLRDIFGNPFRPIAFVPEWRTDTAIALARQMYESRDFGAMPILADALQDAGCDAEELLRHCRDTTATHVRGCWAVDLVLGKE